MTRETNKRIDKIISTQHEPEFKNIIWHHPITNAMYIWNGNDWDLISLPSYEWQKRYHKTNNTTIVANTLNIWENISGNLIIKKSETTASSLDVYYVRIIPKDDVHLIFDGWGSLIWENGEVPQLQHNYIYDFTIKGKYILYVSYENIQTSSDFLKFTSVNTDSFPSYSKDPASPVITIDDYINKVSYVYNILQHFDDNMMECAGSVIDYTHTKQNWLIPDGSVHIPNPEIIYNAYSVLGKTFKNSLQIKDYLNADVCDKVTIFCGTKNDVESLDIGNIEYCDELSVLFDYNKTVATCEGVKWNNLNLIGKNSTNLFYSSTFCETVQHFTTDVCGILVADKTNDIINVYPLTKLNGTNVIKKDNLLVTIQTDERDAYVDDVIADKIVGCYWYSNMNGIAQLLSYTSTNQRYNIYINVLNIKDITRGRVYVGYLCDDVNVNKLYLNDKVFYDFSNVDNSPLENIVIDTIILKDLNNICTFKCSYLNSCTITNIEYNNTLYTPVFVNTPEMLEVYIEINNQLYLIGHIQHYDK